MANKTIYDALKESSVRLSYGNRWLVIDSDGSFVVYEHQYRARHVNVLVNTDNEDEAVRAFVGKNYEW